VNKYSAVALLILFAGPAYAASPGKDFKTLFTFNDSNGANPVSDLLADESGTLYGTAKTGGPANAGIVFSLAPNRTQTTLYSFTGGSDGNQPNSALTEDSQGNFYGTAGGGGASNDGVVFKIAPDGTETVLHSFAGGSTDGGYPVGGVVIDKKGILHGVTADGGPSNDGVVYELHPSGKYKVLHFFAGGAADGALPLSGVIQDKTGDLYGTTAEGGFAANWAPPCCGTVYEVTSDGTFKLLHSFQYGLDGAEPESPPILDASGNLYGATLVGGNANDAGFGVLYKITSEGAESVVHSFAGWPSDGASPLSALTWDKKGNLYGTATVGGANDYGVVFQLAPNGTETVLYSFSETDGVTPYGGLISNKALGGALYGTTSGYFCPNCNTYGSIYKISE